MARPSFLGSGVPLQVLARSSLWAFHFTPSRTSLASSALHLLHIDSLYCLQNLRNIIIICFTAYQLTDWISNHIIF